MDEPLNALDFIRQLREQNGKTVQNQFDFSRYLDFKARKKGVPVHGQFELTPLCNFSCKMCYVHLETQQLKGRPLLSVDIWKDLMRQACEGGMIRASITGGECLTYPGFNDLFEYLQNLGCGVSVLTNGFLLNNEQIRFFKTHRPERIQITLYGSNNESYERVTGRRAFQTVVQNVKNAIDADLPITMNVTPNKYLGEEVFETIRLAKSFGTQIRVNSSIFSPFEETGRSGQSDDPGAEMYVRIYQMIQEMDGIETKEIEPSKLPAAGGPNHETAECGLRCGGGRSSFVINWQGQMSPCARMYMIYADPLKDGFADAWKKINHEANNWPRVPECIDCAYDSICNNCAANMLEYAKPGEQPIALCEQMKYYVQHGVRHIMECE